MPGSLYCRGRAANVGLGHEAVVGESLAGNALDRRSRAGGVVEVELGDLAEQVHRSTDYPALEIEK